MHSCSEINKPVVSGQYREEFSKSCSKKISKYNINNINLFLYNPVSTDLLHWYGLFRNLS